MKKAIAALALVSLSACSMPSISTKKTNNTTISVDFMFENDGCKVYRFFDVGRFHYYVDCRGSTIVGEVHGKTTLSETITTAK